VTVTVVGSVAFDALETPLGSRERVLGGAATHFSIAASFFTDVRVVGVVGDDFGDDEFEVFHRRGIDTRDIERIEGGKSFFWAGRYDWNFDIAQTLDTQLNVFAEFDPKLSDTSRSADVVFLANIQPDLQRRVREQCDCARLVGLDSMNYWIDTARESLVETISGVDAVLLNDAEIRMLTREPNLMRATREIRSWGPRVVVAKQGQYGAALFTDEGFFALPAFPLETVVDPTGAGDSFAGGFLGFLAAHARDELTDELVRCAMAYGSVLASFNVEDFGTERVQRLTRAEIEERFAQFRRITHFEEIPIPARLHAADSLAG
jgi:sugar/nucleoside kinase (ribokinase family)